MSIGRIPDRVVLVHSISERSLAYQAAPAAHDGIAEADTATGSGDSNRRMAARRAPTSPSGTQIQVGEGGNPQARVAITGIPCDAAATWLVFDPRGQDDEIGAADAA
jgi:hypothetical protein